MTQDDHVRQQSETFVQSTIFDENTLMGRLITTVHRGRLSGSTDFTRGFDGSPSGLDENAIA